MSTTEILLVEHIQNLGAEGDVVKVKPGYARNFLIPQKRLYLSTWLIRKGWMR